MFDFPLWIPVQAVIQGVSEFLPISSTGHLGLGWALFDAWGVEVPRPADQQIIDIALHVGTLLAVILYFFGHVGRLIGGAFALFTHQPYRPDPRSLEFVRLAVASAPALVAGLLISDFRAEHKNDLALIAGTTLVFGVLLWVADRFSWAGIKLRNLSLSGAFFVGLMQCLALIPGVSRAGIILTAGRFMGLDREEATRFSMLLAIPIIIGAGLLGGSDLWQRGELVVTTWALVSMAISCLVALGAIHAMMALARRATFALFAAYRVVIGLGLYALLAVEWLPNNSASF